MLSLSMKVKDQAVDLQLINGELCEAGGGVKFGNELMKFAEAVASRDASALMLSRDRLREVAGADVVVDAAEPGLWPVSIVTIYPAFWFHMLYVEPQYPSACK